MKRYRIAFRPNINLLTAGTDPRSLLDELRGLGECTIVADAAAIPPLGKIQPDGCYLAWTIQLATDKGEAAIRDVFMFVEDGAELLVEETAETAPSTPPSPQPKPEAARRPDAPVPPTPAAAAPQPPAKRAPTKESAATSASHSSVRVASERLDLLVNLVGELVMTHSRISQVSTSAKIPALDTPVEDLERIVAAIRDAVLGIRMMPIANSFSRF